jgi:transcriptional regulator with XRE-family HTH domain
MTRPGVVLKRRPGGGYGCRRISCTNMTDFKWNPKTSKAATLLAQGYTRQQVADEVGVSARTIYHWLSELGFSAEVDRLSLMIGVAARAERLRIAQRVARQKVRDDVVETDRDLLDWLKFAQGETDGIKLDLAALATAFADPQAPVAGEGSAGSGEGE